MRVSLMTRMSLEVRRTDWRMTGSAAWQGHCEIAGRELIMNKCLLAVALS